jgi:hypothetical protein
MCAHFLQTVGFVFILVSAVAKAAFTRCKLARASQVQGMRAGVSSKLRKVRQVELRRELRLPLCDLNETSTCASPGLISLEPACIV